MHSGWASEHLHISLATVSGAYEQLVDEGYLNRSPIPGQHGILRRDPAVAGAHMGRHPILHAGAAEHHRVAAADEAASLGKFIIVGREGHLAQFIILSSVCSGHMAAPLSLRFDRLIV